ncbi:MAG TPA: SLATT domain-containing protein [Anaerolineales bacterium]|jgi:hypothetical protein
MEETKTKPAPILTVAWARMAQYDFEAIRRNRSQARLRRWIATLGVLATLFAILTEIYPGTAPATGSLSLKVLLILSPLLASALAAYVNKFYSSGDWLVMRAGAEEIKKEIYAFRSILQNSPKRRQWLERRLVEIQRQVYRSLGGEMVLKPYAGPIPPNYDPKNPESDPGFDDLTGDQYYRYRVMDQLDWHTARINRRQAERTRLQWLLLFAGGAGALLAALGGGFSLWVALSASLATALIGWQELRNLDSAVRNYSKVIMELNVIHDHWNNLETEERTNREFFRMVRATEEILWTQNLEYIKAMQEALAAAELDEAELIDEVLRRSVEKDAQFRESSRDSVVSQTTITVTESQDALAEGIDKALGTLAEEASSELVLQELAAMGEAFSDAAATVGGRASQMTSSLENIAAEFAGVVIDHDTPSETLHAMLVRYPKSGDIKG